MKIAIIGYGKMGRAVEQVALSRENQIHVLHDFEASSSIPDDVDAVIEFTQAKVAPDIICRCLDLGKPVVSGTTGWDAQLDHVSAYCREKNGSMIWAPNFSIGMHIMYTINNVLGTLMDSRTEYEVDILETHHTEKKDEPSGTAISLANQIIGKLKRKSRWQLTSRGELSDDTLGITAERIPDVKGVHRVTYRGPHDIISIRHKALSRDAFAFGAVISAEWLALMAQSGKPGVYTFGDVLENPISPK